MSVEYYKMCEKGRPEWNMPSKNNERNGWTKSA